MNDVIIDIPGIS